MTRWEYALHPLENGADIMLTLHKWGENGWEAWHIREGGFQAGIVVTIFFRRPRVDTAGMSLSEIMAHDQAYREDPNL